MLNTNKKTLYLEITDPDKHSDRLEKAAQILKDGGLVAFPTETVYGLGARADNPEAVKRLFEIKERSSFKGLTYHLSSISQLDIFVRYVPKYAKFLMHKFLPGPVMFIFKKSFRVPDYITGDSLKIGIRIPDNPVTLSLLKKVGYPVVATSANLSGRPSATEPAHVLADLGGRIEALIDSKEESLGLESTILDVTSFPPRILRLGFVTASDIGTVLGKEPLLSENRSDAIEFPKFSPKGELILIQGETELKQSKIKELINFYKDKKVALVLSDETATTLEIKDYIKLGSLASFEQVARNLFSILRKIEELPVDIILIEGVEPAGLGRSIFDRLKAVSSKVIYA